MKIKTIVITAVVLAGIGGGIAYGVYYTMQNNKKPVEVVPVANVNYGYWGDSSTMYGSIISKDSQTVQLNNDYELVKVYVQTGDEVKIGDPLLEYDMTLTELEAEMEDLTRQTLELNLESMQRALDKLNKTTPSASVSLNDGTMTASAEEDMLMDDAAGSAETQPGTTAEQNNGSAQTDGAAETTADAGAADAGAAESTQTGETSGDDLIVDDSIPEDPAVSETEGAAGEIISDDVASDETEAPSVSPEEIITNVNDFLTRVKQLSEQQEDALIASDLQEALRIYRETLTDVTVQAFRDEYGQDRERNVYTMKAAVTDLVGSSTGDVLVQAYNKARVLQLVYFLHLINPQGLTEDQMDETFYQNAEVYIRQAEEIYYDLKLDKVEEELDFQDILPAYYTELQNMVAHLNNTQVVEETETSSEVMTEVPYDYGGDFGSDGSGYTADELKQAIADQESDIAECKLQIRESELKSKQYQRTLDSKIVKSNMKGVVKSAGTVDEAVSNEDFIVITGQAGMYVKGTINELNLDTVSIGDTVTGTSYDTGLPFSASITEISQYPASSDGYYGYGSDNSNASYYPYLAYIEEADGLTEGDAELTLVSSSTGTGIYLENYFIRTESSGKTYVYIQGSDGLLKKQYVRTGMSVYGQALEIKDGVTAEDKIAFPYGSDVVEGAQTKEVDSLNTGYGAYGLG